RDVAVVFDYLVGVAEYDVVDAVRVKHHELDDGAHDHGSEVGGAHPREGAARPPERGAYGVVDVARGHAASFSSSPVMVRSSSIVVSPKSSVTTRPPAPTSKIAYSV